MNKKVSPSSTEVRNSILNFKFSTNIIISLEIIFDGYSIQKRMQLCCYFWEILNVKDMVDWV